MIQAKILEMILKQVLKHPAIKELFKYKDEPNDCDIKVMDLEKKVTDVAFKVTASVDMIKRYSEAIDNVTDKVKSIDKIIEKKVKSIDKIIDKIDKFDSKLKQIDKIAHPPAIPLKDINELKESVKDVKWMMGLFKIMKKNPLLKSIFK